MAMGLNLLLQRCRSGAPAQIRVEPTQLIEGSADPAGVGFHAPPTRYELAAGQQREEVRGRVRVWATAHCTGTVVPAMITGHTTRFCEPTSSSAPVTQSGQLSIAATDVAVHPWRRPTNSATAGVNRRPHAGRLQLR